MKTWLFMFVVLVLALAAVAMAADDPFVGTWKFNPDKSNFPSGVRHYRGFTAKIEVQGNTYKLVGDGVDADGKPVHVENETSTDGKEHPQKDNPRHDAYVAKKVDSRTTNIVFKKGNKEVGTQRMAVSKDYKTLTITNKGKNDKSEDVTMIRVMDRQ